MSAIDLSNVVVVSVQTAPAGVADFKVSNLCLLTDEQPNPTAVLLNGMLYYRNFSALAADWPTTSKVYEVGSLFFSQQQNGIMAEGYLIVAPNNTQVKFYTGHFEYEEGVVPRTFYGINSNTAPTIFTDQHGNQFILDGGDLTIKADPVDGVIPVLRALRPLNPDYTYQPEEQINLTYAGSTTSGITVWGEEQDSGFILQSPLDHFNNSAVNAFWGCAVYLTAGDYGDYLNLQLAAASAAKHRIYGGFTSKLSDLAGPSGGNEGGWIYQAKSNGRFFKAAFDSRNPYAVVACEFAIVQSTIFTGSNTALTLFAKELVGFTADPAMNETVKIICENAGADFICEIGGQNWFWSSPTYLDESYGLLYAEYALLVAYTNVIRTTFTKIPQTESGMLMIKNALAQILDQLVTCGFLAPGKWNNPSKFGDLEDFDAQIQLAGYYIYSTPISSQTQNQRETRKAPLIQIAAKGAGAIHGGTLIFQFEA